MFPQKILEAEAHLAERQFLLEEQIEHKKTLM
jgi:hypothetical protein